jgi:hypothetical protein
MDQPRTDENLRSFLERRERELTEKIRALVAQLAPMEQEIAEIRRSRAALGMPPAQGATNFITTPAGIMPLPRRLERPNVVRALAKAIREKTLGEMSIKHLIIKALFEHFKEGATPIELSHFLSETYKRAIGSGSIRPILGRLNIEGMVVRNLESKWVIDPAALDAIFFHYHDKGNDEDWMLRMAEKLAWTAEDDKACAQAEADAHAGVPREEVKARLERLAGEKLRRA